MMTKTVETVELLAAATGNRREVKVYRYGEPGARPKCYLQASIHAGETPAMMVAHHLHGLLEEAEARGDILGEIVLVPYANPIGLSQVVNAELAGRYDVAGGGNFNRNWPDLAALAAPRVEGKLGADAEENVRIVRDELRELLDEIIPFKELDSLRIALLKLAVDADLVFDMHCDDEALMHCFILPQHWPASEDFAAELGCRAILTAEDSGGGSFDEACSTIWVRLAKRFPDAPIPPACLATTLEFRGYPEVSDELGSQDAAALFRVLQRRGAVAGDPGPLPAPQGEALDLAATDSIKAPSPGVLAYKAELGARVAKGQVVAEIIDPATQTRRPVHAGTDGFILSRRTHKWVATGMSVAKIVGREPLEHRVGYLLED